MLGDCGLKRLGVAYHGDRPEAEPHQQPGEPPRAAGPRPRPGLSGLRGALRARHLHAQDCRATRRAGQHPPVGHGHPVSPVGPVPRPGSAPPLSMISIVSTPPCTRAVMLALVAPLCLAMLVSASAPRNRRCSRWGRQPAVQVSIDGNRNGGLAGELAEGGGQARVAQDLRLDAVDELAQLGHQLLGLIVRGGDCFGGGGIGRQIQPGQPELHGEVDEFLLGRRMQVALGPALASSWTPPECGAAAPGAYLLYLLVWQLELVAARAIARLMRCPPCPGRRGG